MWLIMAYSLPHPWSEGATVDIKKLSLIFITKTLIPSSVISRFLQLKACGHGMMKNHVGTGEASLHFCGVNPTANYVLGSKMSSYWGKQDHWRSLFLVCI